MVERAGRPNFTRDDDGRGSFFRDREVAVGQRSHPAHVHLAGDRVVENGTVQMVLPLRVGRVIAQFLGVLRVAVERAGPVLMRPVMQGRVTIPRQAEPLLPVRVTVEIIIFRQLVMVTRHRHRCHHVDVVRQIHLVGDVGKAMRVGNIDV